MTVHTGKSDFQVFILAVFCCVECTGFKPRALFLPPLEIFNWWDKVQHAIGFGTLAFLAALAYPLVSRYRLAVLLCLQGVAIEVLQYWGGFRFGDWEDAVADAVGVVLGLLVYQLCMRMYSKNNTPHDQ